MTPYQKIFAGLLVGLLTLSSAPQAQEKDGIGYGGAKVQLQPLMVPTRSPDGKIRFEVLTVRLILDVGVHERPGCFSIPMVHEKMLMYLYKANLKPGDFIGNRLDILASNLLDVALKATAKGYYSAVEIVTEKTPPLTPERDAKSVTMTSQCK